MVITHTACFERRLSFNSYCLIWYSHQFKKKLLETRFLGSVFSQFLGTNQTTAQEVCTPRRRTESIKVLPYLRSLENLPLVKAITYLILRVVVAKCHLIPGFWFGFLAYHNQPFSPIQGYRIGVQEL